MSDKLSSQFGCEKKDIVAEFEAESRIKEQKHHDGKIRKLEDRAKQMGHAALGKINQELKQYCF